MSNATLYTKDDCPYCVRAKRLLEEKGIDYIEINAPLHKDLMIKRIVDLGHPAPRTVPQIFLDEEYVGGFTELAAKLK